MARQGASLGHRLHGVAPSFSTMTTQALQKTIQKACTGATWSAGVQLSRAGSVVLERRSDDELELRVVGNQGLSSVLVCLYPGDDDWSCECNSREDVCAHVAAAVIAYNRARNQGEELPTAAEASGRLGYRLSREGGDVRFSRVLVGRTGEQELGDSVVALANAHALVATQTDLQIEAALGSRTEGLLPRELWQRLWRHLRDVDDLTLDGKPVRAGEGASGLQLVVEDCALGVRLRLEQDAAVDELFKSGLLRTGDSLGLILDPGLSAREMDELRRGRVFRPDELATLVGEVLPRLEQRLPTLIHAQSLPKTLRMRPRVIVDVDAEGDGLSLLATLVYGDPPVARVDGELLRPLGDGKLPLRDQRAEERELARLRRQLSLEIGLRRHVPAGQLPGVLVQLEDFVGEVRGQGHQRFFVVDGLKPQLEVQNDDFQLTFCAQASDTGGKLQVGAQKLIEAWQEGLPLLALPGGGFAHLPSEWLAAHGRLVLDLLAAKQATGAVPSSAAFDLGRLCAALEQPPPPQLAGLAQLARSFEGVPSAPLPADVAAQLRDYQQRGVDWLVFLRQAGLGALLADDMGLGKTLQALCAIRGRTLVIAPTSVLSAWAEQAARFRPGLSYNVYHGPKRKLDAAADLTLTTYALLRLDSDILAAESWDTVVLDEAQAIKNPDSQAAQAAFRLRADFRLALTGTPVENRLLELWSILHFLNPGLLGGRSDFDVRYARPIAVGEPQVAAHLRARLRPFVLRRKKSEVAPELPPRTEVTLRCQLSADERNVYDAVRAATREQVLSLLQGEGSVLSALEALLRLRQAACHAALVPGQRADSSAKLSLLIETLDEAVSEGHKALVFSQWTSLLDLLEPELKKAGLPFVRLDGSTTNRAGVVAAFQASDGPPVMIISLKAGGTGLTLTAADHVFLLDPWWNPAVEDQAADRAHRIGQQRPVIVHRLVAEDTVEERILLLQEQKRSLAEAALGEGEAAAALSRDDLLALLA